MIRQCCSKRGRVGAGNGRTVSACCAVPSNSVQHTTTQHNTPLLCFKSAPAISYPPLLDSELMITCHLMHSDVRYVLDLTDHVWAEVWVPALSRYVHLDPCERAFDKPLMYESGWNKNLTHVISFSRYGAVNATSRYTRKLAQVILRRSADAETR
jgi:Rad4 transglutaminase-like domain